MKNYPIPRMLSKYGITANDAQQLARQFLYDRGVIGKNPGRPSMAAHKIEYAIKELYDAFSWHCNNGNCRRAAARDNPKLLVERFACMYCGGSNDCCALRNLAVAMENVGKGRILVVGGTKAKWQEIENKSPDGRPNWKFIDGTKAPPNRLLKGYHKWADVIVIWSRTPLDHRVSVHFDIKSDTRVVKAPSTGIASLAKAVSQHLADSRESALAP